MQAKIKNPYQNIFKKSKRNAPNKRGALDCSLVKDELFLRIMPNDLELRKRKIS